MARKKKVSVKRTPAPAPRPARPPLITTYGRFIAPAAVSLVVLVCFWTPLTSSETSILWDAADYYQVVQNYFSEEIRAGRMPFWTPYVWCGYPFLADPQVGAWFLPNWPFFLAGVSPRAMQFELFLASLLASLGAYFLALRLTGEKSAASLAGLAYGLSGFFVSHSSHTTIVQVAACLPWLLWLFLRAMEERPWVNGVLAVLVSGGMILAGHFQSILYGFMALALFALGWLAVRPGAWRRTLLLCLAISLGGTVLSAIGTLPGLELVLASTRTELAAIDRKEGMIVPSALLTLLRPDHFGVLAGNYRGPQDITQYYYYAGLLVIPLAVAGIWSRKLRWAGLFLVIIPIWYGLGHSAGLYLIMARLPGFKSIRAPANGWFVPALGLALLAAAGFALLRRRWPMKWAAALVLTLLAADLWRFNFDQNPLAYARKSYEELYGRGQRFLEGMIASSGMPPLTRFDGAERIGTFGPMSHPLSARVEAVYGYGPLPFREYGDYTVAMQSNPKLRNGLGVSRFFDLQKGQIVANPDYLPRAWFAKSLLPAASREESRRLLATLDPAEKTIVPAKLAGLTQDPAAKAEIKSATPGGYLIHYTARSDSLLRIATAYFPGWRARVNGRPLEVLRVDHTLIGVVVPAGEHDLTLEYRSTYFPLGAALTIGGVLACAALLVRFRR